MPVHLVVWEIFVNNEIAHDVHSSGFLLIIKKYTNLHFSWFFRVWRISGKLCEGGASSQRANGAAPCQEIFYNENGTTGISCTR